MSEVTCPKCGKRYQLTAERAGKGARCACGCRFVFPPLTDPTDGAVAKAKELAPVVAQKGKEAAGAAAKAAKEYAPKVAGMVRKYAPVAGRGLKKWAPVVLWWGVWQPLRLLALALSWPGRWWWRRRQARRRAEAEYWAGREEVRDLARAWPAILRMSFAKRRPPTLNQFAYALALGVLPVRASKASMMLSIAAAKRAADAGRPGKPILGGMSDADLALVYEFLRND